MTRDYKLLTTELEEEFTRFVEDGRRDPSELVKKLYPYIQYEVAQTVNRMQARTYLCGQEEDICQEVIRILLEKGIHEFERREARFYSYCARIAERQTVSFLRRSVREEPGVDPEAERFSSEASFSAQEDELPGPGCNPERYILALERRLEMAAGAHSVLRFMMNCGKPHRTVSSCFSIALFQKYFPDSKELSSPSWAYERLRESDVQGGADRFLNELKEWIPGVDWAWGSNFSEGLEEELNGCRIAELVYGECFRVKDFENWSQRMRKQIRDYYYESGKWVEYAEDRRNAERSSDGGGTGKILDRRGEFGGRSALV